MRTKNILFGSRLTEQREQHGLSKAQLARDLDCSRQAIIAYEHGQVPSMPVLGRMAELFEVSVDYLLGRTERHPPVKGGDRMDQSEQQRILGHLARVMMHQSLILEVLRDNGLLNQDDAHWEELVARHRALAEQELGIAVDPPSAEDQRPT